MRSIPDIATEDVVAAVDHQLQVSAIAPSLRAHDGVPFHIYWTSAASPFAHQVAVEVMMGLAQMLCGGGTERFGRCGADGCERVYYDTTETGRGDSATIRGV